MKNKILIHIGLPKCASTSLQHLLLNQENIYYLGKKYNNQYRGDELEYFFREYLTKSHEMEYDYSYARSVIAPYIDEALVDNKPIVLSDELFSGIGFYSYLSRVFRDPAQILMRLSTLFKDDVIFIVVIREQASFLKSFYAQLINHGYNLTYQQFVFNELSRPSNMKSVLSYGQYLKYMLNQFATVRVVLFEQLARKELSFRRVFSEYGANIDDELPHSGPRDQPVELSQTLLKNLVNIRGAGNYPSITEYFQARQLMADKSGTVVTTKTFYQLDDTTKELFAETFSQENRLACELLNEDLGNYGYLV